MSKTFAINFPSIFNRDGKSVLMSTCRNCFGTNVHVLERHGAFTYVTHSGHLRDNGEQCVEVTNFSELKTHREFTKDHCVTCPACGEYYRV